MNSTIADLTKFMFIESPEIPSVDITLVLGHQEPKVMENVYPLYEKKLVSKILISGYASLPEHPPEAVCFATYGNKLGIAENDLVIDTKATNTKENFQEFLKILKKDFDIENIKKVLLVTKAFHLRRASITAQSILPKHFEYYYLPVFDNRKINKNNWWQDPKRAEIVMSELKKIGQYYLQGDLSFRA